jgi:tetratricopeptide (TPR) repeat protein
MTRVTSAIATLVAVITFCSLGFGEESVEFARARFNEGVALVDQDRFEEALVIFRELEQTRSHPVLVYNIGWCLSGLDRNAEAIETFESYLEQGDDSPERVQQAREELERLRSLPQPPANVNVNVNVNVNEPVNEDPTETETETETVTETEPERTSRRRLSPGLFWGFLGLTAATGAALIGTGAATMSISNGLRDDWVQEDFDRGDTLAWVSNGLLIALVCEAIVTLVLGIFTDFRRERSEASSSIDEM